VTAPHLYRKGTTPEPGLYAKVYNIKNKATTPVLAGLLVLISSPLMSKLNPVAKRSGKQHSNDIKRRYLLPLLSMNQYAMCEKKKFAAPKPNDSPRLSICLNPVWPAVELVKNEAARKANILIPLICCAAIGPIIIRAIVFLV
jgi:hypothetical protein